MKSISERGNLVLISGLHVFSCTDSNVTSRFNVEKTKEILANNGEKR